MSKTAWYIGCKTEDVAERVILLGDPGRVARLGLLLSDVEQYPQQRGLHCLSGNYRDTRITACAFGMGAPIAAIVMHELFDLGARTFLRVGTAMSLPPAERGEFIIAEAAYRGEGTSAAYAPVGYPAVADFELQSALRNAIGRDARWRSGVYASFDGFYRQMYALDGSDSEEKQAVLAQMKQLHVMALDMETSALLTVARTLRTRAGCLCMATVDAASGEKLAQAQLDQAEPGLFRYALEALSATPSV